MQPFSITLFSALAVAVSARTVTLFNDRPRLAIDGSFVDASDGMILAVGSPPTYFLYGESYGNTTGAAYPWPNAPHLAVYTSPDMESWTYRGACLNASASAASTQWIPNVFYDPRILRFIMWYGVGDWGVATSQDGIHFDIVHEHTSSRLGGQTDGTGIFIDDDPAATGYVIFAALVTDPGTSGHLVSIERLAPDYLSSTKINVSGFFPDGLVESPALFKRNGVYYATYGRCCCACRGGGGIVVFTAPRIDGPWTRQAPWGDVNCQEAAQICPDQSHLVFNAQWWGVSLIPTLPATTYMFTGKRWLSGPDNPPACSDMCSNGGDPGACTAPDYYLRSDFSVWYPLEFEADGSVSPLHALPNFTLALP